MAEGTERYEDRDDNFARREMVYGKPLKIDDEDYHGEGDSSAPEDIAGNDGPEGVVGVWKDFGDDAARSRGDDGGDDGEEPDGCHGGEGDLVDVHSVESVRDALNVDGWGQGHVTHMTKGI